MDNVWNTLAGYLTGVLSGFGVGGGTLLLLWLTLAQDFPQQRAGAVNLIYFLCCALPALYGHVKNGLLHWQAVLWCAAAGVPACAAASFLAAGMDTGLLHRIFGGFILLIGLREVFAPAKPHSPGPGQESSSSGS